MRFNIIFVAKCKLFQELRGHSNFLCHIKRLRDIFLLVYGHTKREVDTSLNNFFIKLKLKLFRYYNKYYLAKLQDMLAIFFLIRSYIHFLCHIKRFRDIFLLIYGHTKKEVDTSHYNFFNKLKQKLFSYYNKYYFAKLQEMLAIFFLISGHTKNAVSCYIKINL